VPKSRSRVQEKERIIGSYMAHMAQPNMPRSDQAGSPPNLPPLTSHFPFCYPSHPGGRISPNSNRVNHLTFSTRHTFDFYNSPHLRFRPFFAAKKKSIATKVETGFAVSHTKQTTAPLPDRNKMRGICAPFSGFSGFTLAWHLQSECFLHNSLTRGGRAAIFVAENGQLLGISRPMEAQ
jgi:hypothetical protein